MEKGYEKIKSCEYVSGLGCAVAVNNDEYRIGDVVEISNCHQNIFRVVVGNLYPKKYSPYMGLVFENLPEKFITDKIIHVGAVIRKVDILSKKIENLKETQLPSEESEESKEMYCKLIHMIQLASKKESFSLERMFTLSEIKNGLWLGNTILTSYQQNQIKEKIFELL